MVFFVAVLMTWDPTIMGKSEKMRLRTRVWAQAPKPSSFAEQVLLTWNENLCERSEKIEVEDRIQKTGGEDEETVLDFRARY